MLSLFAWLYFYSIFVILAYSFIKLSIGVFLLRLTQRTKFKWALRGILGDYSIRTVLFGTCGLSLMWVSAFLVAFTLGSVLPIIFQCTPVAAGYDLTLRPPFGTATCYSPDIFKKVGVFNSCEYRISCSECVCTGTNQHSHQYRYGLAVRDLAYSISMETTTQHSYEDWVDMYPQSWVLRRFYRNLQDANAVPLFRRARLHWQRLMVLYEPTAHLHCHCT